MTVKIRPQFTVVIQMKVKANYTLITTKAERYSPCEAFIDMNECNVVDIEEPPIRRFMMCPYCPPDPNIGRHTGARWRPTCGWVVVDQRNDGY